MERRILNNNKFPWCSFSQSTSIKIIGLSAKVNIFIKKALEIAAIYI